MNQMTYAGMDPGSTGAYAVLDSDGTILTVQAINATSWGRILYGEGRDYEAPGIHPDRVTLERVDGSPVMSPSNAFAFGRSYQWCIDQLIVHYNPTPQQWQRAWSEDLAGLKGSARKAALANIARGIYPGIKFPDYAADAVLLAHWCRGAALGHHERISVIKS